MTNLHIVKSIILISLVIISLCSAQSICVLSQIEVIRHTPGFPYNISSEFLVELLKNLMIKKLINDMKYDKNYLLNHTFSQIFEKNKTITQKELYEMINNIEDKDIRTTLEKIVSNYIEEKNIDQEQLMNVINKIMDSKASVDDIAKALGIIERITREIKPHNTSKTTETMIENIIHERFADLIKSHEPMFYEFMKNIEIKSSTSLEPSAFKSAELLSPLPTLGTSLLDLVPLVLLVVIIIFTSLIVISMLITAKHPGKIKLRSISRKFKKIDTSKIIVPREDTTLCRAVANYWKAVSFVEKLYGVRKEEWMTHREYLSKVSHLLESKAEIFSRITEIYEVVRFGQKQDNELDTMSEKYIISLVGEENDKTSS